MFKDSKHIFEELYSDIDGYNISYSARASLPYWYIGHTYGEITYQGFIKMLEAANPKAGEVFYDLGSGTGKAVILASMMANFSVLTGVEILKPLYDVSNQVLQKYLTLPGKSKNNKNIINKIKFINDDFNNINFSNADIIYINATCLNYELNNTMIKKLEGIKKNARIITNSCYINSEIFELKHIGTVLFTWGPDNIFLHRKL